MTAFARTAARKAEPATPEEIRTRIVALKERSANLDVWQVDLAERSIADPKAEDAYRNNLTEGVQIDSEIKRLEQALTGMAARADQQRTAEQEAAAAAARRRVAALLDERSAVADEFQNAIGAAIKAMRRLAALGEEIGLAWPGPSPDGMAAVCAPAAVLRYCGAEMFRQSGAPIPTGGVAPERGKLPLPAAKPLNYDYMNQPEKTPSLTAAIAEANAYARQALEGRPQ